MTKSTFRSTRGLIGIGVVVVLLILASTLLAVNSSAYRLQFVMLSATGVLPGQPVLVRGEQAGTIDKLEVHDNHDALVTVEMGDGYEPLHEGTDARVVWSATLRSRALEILPGPAATPQLASDSRVVSGHEQVELDDLLKTLDPETMSNVKSLVQQLRGTLDGREQQLNASIQTAGSAVDAVGNVLSAVGSDGPAIRQLVTQLHGVTAELSRRQGELGGTVNDLGPVTRVLTDQQQQLSRSVSELPSTLSQARTTLDNVPAATDETVPLLNDLQPATAKLPGVAADLNPVLSDLRPVVGELRPTLDAANELLGQTPRMLDTAHEVVPPLTRTVDSLRTPVAFLRPYIPEATGWLANWVGLFGRRTSTGGHFATAQITTGGHAVNDNPGVLPPGNTIDPAPAPGSLVNQPWTDANGDAPQ